jgi:hypothetical protein
MAHTESSAVVRFIHLAQQQQIRESGFVATDATEVMAPMEGGTSRTLFYVLSAFILTLGVSALVGFWISSSGGDALAVASTPALALPATAPASTPAPAPVAVTPTTDGEAAFDLRVTPSGAEVQLDGRALGVAPLRVSRLQPGRHTIDIAAPAGYVDQRLEVDLGAGERPALRVDLEAVAPPPAAETVAKLRAPPPIVSEPLPEPLTVSAPPRAERTPSARQKSLVAAARPAVPSQPLAPSQSPAPSQPPVVAARPSAERAAPVAPATPAPASAPAGKGTLMVGSKPPCDILIDGRRTGLRTPQRAIELAAGQHTVVLVNTSLGIEERFSVTITADQTERVIKDLLPR